jgi:nitrogen-specific signal transduction histidine kinase
MSYSDYQKLHDARMLAHEPPQEEYEALRDEYDPIIETLSDEADQLARRFKRLVREAADALRIRSEGPRRPARE